MKPLPFKPGTSPFHINGVFYQGVRKYIEERVPGGLESLEAILADGELVRFMRQTFLATAYYDLLPIVPVTESLARQQKRPFGDFVRRRSRAQALADCQGVYKAYIGRYRPPESIERALFEGIVKTSARIYNFGAVEYQLRPGQADVVRTEVPDPCVAWYQTSTAEYLCAILEHAELQEVQVHCQRKELAHTLQGCKVWRLHFHAEWRPPEADLDSALD